MEPDRLATQGRRDRSAGQVAGHSEVVPHAGADLLFVVVGELVLLGLAVEVLQSETEQMAACAPPRPAGLHSQPAAKIDLLAQVGVDGQEGRPLRPVGRAGVYSTPN